MRQSIANKGGLVLEAYTYFRLFDLPRRKSYNMESKKQNVAGLSIRFKTEFRTMDLRCIQVIVGKYSPKLKIKWEGPMKLFGDKASTPTKILFNIIGSIQVIVGQNNL